MVKKSSAIFIAIDYSGSATRSHFSASKLKGKSNEYVYGSIYFVLNNFERISDSQKNLTDLWILPMQLATLDLSRFVGSDLWLLQFHSWILTLHRSVLLFSVQPRSRTICLTILSTFTRNAKKKKLKF